jgi:hypothetical protein
MLAKIIDVVVDIANFCFSATITIPTNWFHSALFQAIETTSQGNRLKSFSHHPDTIHIDISFSAINFVHAMVPSLAFP